ncbi:hypothetical protein [Tardiphaga robiniae]|jgi:hypothetical protein|uniref:hypothetical protein n=1 Tax=Tardiphaga robiniae TaxID=943830 RepID=UPI0011118EC2|nr:hypothetical protein [Tardiphaga robiniae]
MNAGLFYLPDDWRDNQNNYGRRGHLRGGRISSLKVRVVSQYTLSQRTSLIALSRPALVLTPHLGVAERIEHDDCTFDDHLKGGVKHGDRVIIHC